MLGYVSREPSVSAAEEQMAMETAATITVDRDDDVHVVHELGERRGVLRIEMRRRDMVSMRRRLNDAIEGSARSARHLFRDGIGRTLQITAVIGHHAESSPQLAELGDFSPFEKFSQHEVIPPVDGGV
jgi:hypothetical protein